MKSAILLNILLIFGITGYQTINFHGYVDLGLPSGLLWANSNMGANLPEQPGDFYSWGEIRTRPIGLYKGKTTLKSEIPDYSGDTIYDAARANWGAEWRTPTYNEFQELIDFCKWEYKERNGMEGYLVTGPNGASIFLPLGGWYTRDEKSDARSLYWSSTPTHSSYDGTCLILISPERAMQFKEMEEILDTDHATGENGISMDAFPRKYGGMIRPVHNSSGKDYDKSQQILKLFQRDK